MSIQYSPPHVVQFAYARACVENVEDLWVRLSNEVYVIERRLDAVLFESLKDTKLTLNVKGVINDVGLEDLYAPIYFGAMIPELPGWDNPVSAKPRPDSGPVAWWLQVDLVAPSERIRFPMLAAKVNMTEWMQMGELRELYSYDGFGFTLRDNTWGRD